MTRPSFTISKSRILATAKTVGADNNPLTVFSNFYLLFYFIVIFTCSLVHFLAVLKRVDLGQEKQGSAV